MNAVRVTLDVQPFPWCCEMLIEERGGEYDGRRTRCVLSPGPQALTFLEAIDRMIQAAQTQTEAE